MRVMENQLIYEMKKILSKTLDYKMVLQDLAEKLESPEIQGKLQEFAAIEKKESKTLIYIIINLGGDLELIEQTGQQPLYWIAKPLPDPGDLPAVLDGLIGGERNKEQDYHKLLAHQNLSEEHKNRLDVHRKQREECLRYFQSTKISLENRSE